jgi:hypothetical protein
MPTPEISDEIAAFITEGTHRLAIISLNDYGFLLSSRMAQTYLDQALHQLESKRGFDRAFLNEVGLLKAAAQSIACEYAQFEKFCNDCDRFKQLETRNWRERLSKWAVRAIARSHRVTVSHHLAHKIRTLHSRICSILTGK